MVANIREGLMAINTKSRDHTGNNVGFVVSSSSEQQSISSEISNPRQERKELQLNEILSPSSNNSQLVIMDKESAQLQVVSPPLSPVVEPKCVNTVPTSSTTPTDTAVSPHQSPQTRPTTTLGGGGEGSLPKLIDGSYPQQDSKSNPQNTNDSRKLFVGGLPKDVTAEEFYMYFAQYGEIIDSFIVYDRETGKPRGFGFVTFVDPEVCRRLLHIYEKENTSISEDEVVGWNEDADTIDGSYVTLAQRPPSTRLQMRGRFIELKIAQPRGDTVSIKVPAQQSRFAPISTRPSRPRYQKPRYFTRQNNYYSDCSSYDGEYDDMNKISATLSQQQQLHHHHQYTPPQSQPSYLPNHHQYHTPSPRQAPQPPPPPPPLRRPPGGGYGYMNPPLVVPMTPGGPMSGGGSQRYNNNHPAPHVMMTPSTPAQTALDIAHHMIFYAQLLATPSMVNNANYDDMHYYHEQILSTGDTESVAGSQCYPNYTPSQPPPRPCTPSLSVPEVIVSPSKKRSTGVSEVFQIGGGIFYPDTTLSSSPPTTTNNIMTSKKVSPSINNNNNESTTSIPTKVSSSV